MNIVDFITESAEWNLSVGTELVSPRDRELAVVKSINNYDLGDAGQRRTFQAVLRKHMSTPGGRRSEEYPSAIRLNDVGDNQYAHTVTIDIVAGTRKGKQFLYVVYDNQPTKTWETYAGTSNRNINLDSNPRNGVSGREKLRRILASNLLPVEPIKGGAVADPNRSMAAGGHWQVVDIGARPARARDRVKPNQISKLGNTENEFWNTHPDVQRALAKLSAATATGDRAKIDAAKTELNTAQNATRSDRPTPTMLKNSPMTATGIRDMVRTSRAKSAGKNIFRSFFPQRKKEYLADLLNVFLEHPGQPREIYPMTIVNNVDRRSTMVNTGISNAKSITTDFMEVVHPVALVTGNTTGNAQRMILEFLGASSYEELMKTATISYGSNNTGALVDSFIFNKTRQGTQKLQISSKSGGGAAASVKSLAVAYEEVMRNQVSKRLWERDVERNREYKDAYDFLNMILENKDYSWKAALQAGVRFDIIAESDVALIEQYAALAGKNVKDKSEEEKLDEATGVSQFEQIYARFSSDLKGIYIQTGTDSDEPWHRIIGGIWTELIDEINSSTAFGNIVVWLFNHSATVQINTLSSNMKQGDKDALVLNNIVATWPTQLVETAELTLGPSGIKSGSMRFGLKINGYEQALGTADLVSPLSNRSDISTMPAGDAPQPPDDDARRGWPAELGGRGLTKQEKALAKQRKVGAGTDNLELPPAADRVAPDGTVIRAKEPRQPRQPKVVNQQSPAVLKITEFLNAHHIDDQTATPASSYRFAVKILRNDLDNSRIIPAFIELMSDPAIQALVKRETIDTMNHAPGVVNEARYSDQDVVSTITFIYWALTFKRYIEAGKTSTQQYIQVKNTLLRVGNELIKDGGWNRQFNSAVASVERQAHVQVQGSATADIGQPGSRIQVLRQQMSPAKRREFDIEMNNMLANGDSIADIENEAQYYLGEGSRILRGILG
jgi:hypothetical protein